jgi:hypothetical protein
MRCFTCLCILLATLLSIVQAAPVPERKDAKPAVIDAGTEDNIPGLMESIVWGARVGVRENEKVAGLGIIRQQKDWQGWLKKNLHLERVERTTLIRVSFKDGSREEQAAIINVVVDYYLKHDVDDTRASLKRAVELIRSCLRSDRRMGKITEEQFAKGMEDLKKREERIRRLPALVEHAKDR